MSTNGIEQILAQMRSLSATAGNGLANSEENNSSVSFSGMLKNSINEVNNTQVQATELKQAFELGEGDANLADVMVAVQKSSVSFEAMLQVRNKLVEAYKEVMNMPV